MATGENEAALRRIIDFTRLAGLLVLGLHCYFYCYGFFAALSFNSTISDRLLKTLAGTGLFTRRINSKLLALVLLLVSLLGARGKKQIDLSFKRQLVLFFLCIGFYFSTDGIFTLGGSLQQHSVIYITATLSSYLGILAAGTRLSRVIWQQLNDKDIFNRLNESFPQEERLLENSYSVNLPATYNFRGKDRRSWINCINPFRGLLVLGTPGSGKSYFVIQHVIRQHIRKGFAMLVYDFKFDDLSVIAYNTWLQHKSALGPRSACFFIDFDRLLHRCNPLEPQFMEDITDASESSRTILLGLNREWIKKQGDFFVESAINFLTAIIWYLRKYNGGEYCTLPHVIELMQVDYDKLFSILRLEKEIEVLINPFVSAYLNDVMEQLEGQVAAAKISMARLVSPQLYYVMSGADFTLDLNNPSFPKIVCLGNNPQKQQVYGAVLSLYVSRIIKTVNKKDKHPCSLVFDEFPTIYVNNMDSLIATARSNKVATTIGVQDYSQLRKDYGKDQADVIMNIAGNVIAGQVMGETAKQLSERIGKIMQDRTNLSINRMDTSITQSKQLEFAIPASRIAGLSSGEFVGMLADNPDCLLPVKAFHCKILPMPTVGRQSALPMQRNVDTASVQANYFQIKQDVQSLVDNEINRMMEDPVLQLQLVRK